MFVKKKVRVIICDTSKIFIEGDQRDLGGPLFTTDQGDHVVGLYPIYSKDVWFCVSVFLSDVNWQLLISHLVAMTMKLLPTTLPTFWWLNYISRPNIKRGMSHQSLSKQWKLSYKKTPVLERTFYSFSQFIPV